MAKEKDCPPGKILNPVTGRCVKEDGAIGSKLMKAKKAAEKEEPKKVKAITVKTEKADKEKPKKEKPKKTTEEEKATKVKTDKVDKKDTKVKTEKPKKAKGTNPLFKHGQKKEAPPEDDPQRRFYVSLLKQKPESKMANKWCIDHGLMPAEYYEQIDRENK